MNEDEKWLINLCKTETLLYSDPYSKENLRIMKELVLNVSENIDKNLLYVFINHLNNYYLLNLSENYDDLRKELFDSYKFMFEKGFFTLNDKPFISYSEYRSVLHISAGLENFEWSERFIEYFKDMFKNEKKEYIYDYSNALLCYVKKKYQDSLKIISNIHPREQIEKIDIDILRLKIFYELDYFDSSISVINSLRYYIYNNSNLNKEI
ncbi:MAG: hypothetical protein JSS91_14300 [Bacteroidetes bacterium]|nr:hypothetical protein [Bacteroidota bacterium]